MLSIVFPGQGSQFVGMGKDILDSYPEVKIFYDEVDDALNQKLSNIIFNGPEEELILTENAQPAIMVVGIAIIKILSKRGFEVNNLFKFSAGHSLGEYTSLAALNSLSLSDTAKLLKIRGKSMQSSFPKDKGSMAAILGLKRDEVEEALLEKKNESICQIANDNAPGQVVISGEIHCVEEVIELLNAKGAKKVVKLPVSAPFHCDLMQKAKDVMSEEINNTFFEEPLVPIIQNVSVEPTKETEVIKKNLIDQVTGTVRWRETMLKFVELNVSCIVEVGAGTVLTNLAKRNSPNLKRITLNSKENIENFMKECE
tara:strand:- start:1510 stop:2448 length:939 start_codon:yes stop_codon:yes gene_type:complete